MPALSWILLVTSLLASSAAYAETPKGYGLLQAGDRQWVLSDAELKDPRISMAVYRDRWYRMEPSNNAFNFNHIKGQVARYRQFNKRYILGVMTGAGSSPSWIPGPRTKNSSGTTLIAPWAPAIPQQYGELLAALSNVVVGTVKLKDDPLLVGVWAHGATVPSQEFHTNGVERAPDFDGDGIARNAMACMDAANKYFPTTPLIFSISVQTPVQAYQPKVIAHLQGIAGKERAVFQHNSLYERTSLTAVHQRTLVELAKQGYVVGAETLGALDDPMYAFSRFPSASYFVCYRQDRIQLR